MSIRIFNNVVIKGRCYSTQWTDGIDVWVIDPTFPEEELVFPCSEIEEILSHSAGSAGYPEMDDIRFDRL